MIVKNEANVIRRCLDSVRPIIDHWVIVDTGSTDGTQDVIRAAMADVPGMLVERPWVDFAFNRNEALQLARPRADYSLIIDADDLLIIPDNFVFPKLDEAGYLFTIIAKDNEYSRIQLVNNEIDWRYRGVVHEFLDCPGHLKTPKLQLSMRCGDDGARQRDQTTELHDLAVLEKALSAETDPFMISRYVFYLARSYRDTVQHFKALEFFLRRGELGFGEEEVYLSLLEAVTLMEKLGAPDEPIINMYDRIIPICPDRAEARFAASRFCRTRKNFEAGYRYAESGLDLKLPDQGISINAWIYRYGLREELAANAFNLKYYRFCLMNCLIILEQPEMPPYDRARCRALAHEALAKLVDPVWGYQQVPYKSEFVPDWQN